MRIVGPALLLVVAFVASLLALMYGGAADAPAFTDPGPVVRFGLPAAKLIVNLSAAVAIGSLVLTSFALSREDKAWGPAIDLAAAGAAVWTIASAATGFFIFMSVYQQPLSLEPQFGTVLSEFITDTEIGIAWLVTTLIAAAVTALCFAVRHPIAIAFVTVLAVAGLVPMATQGHAAGTAGHAAAVNGLGLHLVGAAVWLGGLVMLVVLQRQLENPRLITIVERYSTLALFCFIVVAISGYASAALRVGSLDQLFTPYGGLVVVKVVALLVLGFAGMLHRRFLIGRMQTKLPGKGTTAFWWLVVAELGFMGIASGVASALGRTATPVVEELFTFTPAAILSGELLPPPVQASSFLTEWRFDILWILVAAGFAFFYLAAVRRLRKRGDSWPVLRTVSWLAGVLLLFYVTNGAPNVYERYLFSVHMLGHMVLTMMIPVLLVPGAPVTLASRAIRKRVDGSRGVREWMLWGVQTRLAGFLSNPIVAAILFAGSLWVFYYSPLFRWATTEHLGHQWMIVHFLITGYLFVQSLIGVDPIPYRAPYPLRLLLLLGTMAFHAFFGLGLMMGEGLLLSDWYGAMGWGTDALADQRAGGGIAWSVGEIPTIILAIAVAISWSRSDDKLTKRLDRRAERDGDAELNAYNEMLAERESSSH